MKIFSLSLYVHATSFHPAIYAFSWLFIQMHSIEIYSWPFNVNFFNLNNNFSWYAIEKIKNCWNLKRKLSTAWKIKDMFLELINNKMRIASNIIYDINKRSKFCCTFRFAKAMPLFNEIISWNGHHIRRRLILANGH